MVALLIQETFRRDIDDLDERAPDDLARPARCDVVGIARDPDHVHVMIDRDLFYQYAGFCRVPVAAELSLDGKAALSIVLHHEIVITDGKADAADSFDAPVVHDLEIICWWPRYALAALGWVFYINGDIDFAIREDRILFEDEFRHNTVTSQPVRASQPYSSEPSIKIAT